MPGDAHGPSRRERLVRTGPVGNLGNHAPKDQSSRSSPLREQGVEPLGQQAHVCIFFTLPAVRHLIGVGTGPAITAPPSTAYPLTLTFCTRNTSHTLERRTEPGKAMSNSAR